MRVIALSLNLLLLATVASANETTTICRWTFDDQLPGEAIGDVKIDSDRLTAPAYPDFPKQNQVLHLRSGAFVRIPDAPSDDRFDFDNGDEVTFEAWVRMDSIGENVCLISKGRTGRSGDRATNQNWAFRLRRQKGQACVNFLFRSRASDNHKSDWHRWTSKSGISPGSRWHHVALSYVFGQPKSIRAYVDGKPVKGDWDMAGPTTQPPVVDEDAVVIGSTMNGLPNNSLNGALDNVAIHRSIVPPEDILSRYRYVPQPAVPPQIDPDQITVQLFSVGNHKSLPTETDQPLLEWRQSNLAFAALPQRYDSWGVRDDWGKIVLVRAWADIHFPKEPFRLMVRSRGLSELKVDNEAILKTPAQATYSNAHQKVKDLPEVPHPDMRPAAMSDHEQIVEMQGDGRIHRLQWDIILGGPSYRVEFGETSLSIATGDGMFHILSPISRYPLTDDGWRTFAEQHRQHVASINLRNRNQPNPKLETFWDKRHQFAKQNLLSDAAGARIDDVIEERVRQHNAELDRNLSAPTADSEFFAAKIQPIFDAHCTRCHGEKEQGGLLVSSRTRLLEGGESGSAAIVPGHPEDSYLFQLVSAPADDYRMPPKGDGLTEAEVALMKQWIEAGAPMPQTKSNPVTVPDQVDRLTFLRRLSLDTVGVPPTYEEVQQFLNDPQPDATSRVVDRLLQDDRWADNWTGYWQDVLAENPNLLKPTLNNTGPFRYWIHEALTDNKPIDRFATELMMMRGGMWSGGAAGFALASQNDVPMAAKAHVIGSAFLGVNMKCARCHDAPYHQWKQSDLFEVAAMLDRSKLKLPESSTVPAAFFEKQARQSLIEVTLRPGAEVQPHFPLQQLAPPVSDELLLNPADTREQLAAQVTASRRFAEVVANRMWKRLMGAGLVEPADDWEGNPAIHPELLAALADRLILADYDIRELARAIFESDAYQREAIDLPARRQRFFQAPYRRRMTAEQVVDSAFHVVGSRMDTEMLTLDVEGTLPADRFLNFGYPRRAWEFTTLANERDRPSLALPKVQTIIDVLKAFGWRNSRPEPETDREEAPNLIQPGVLANGTMGLWLTTLTDQHGLTRSLAKTESVDETIDLLFLQILTRSPTNEEREQFRDLLSPGFEERTVPEAERGTPYRPRRFRYVSWSNHLNTDANIIKVQMQELIRQGPPPTTSLRTEWRERAEDAIWSLMNSPEMVMVP